MLPQILVKYPRAIYANAILFSHAFSRYSFLVGCVRPKNKVPSSTRLSFSDVSLIPLRMFVKVYLSNSSTAPESCSDRDIV